MHELACDPDLDLDLDILVITTGGCGCYGGSGGGGGGDLFCLRNDISVLILRCHSFKKNK